MNLISRTITGVVLIVGGVALAAVSFFSSLIFLIYGLVVVGIGLFIFFNKKEDQIEQRKDTKSLKGGKKK